MLLFMQHGDKTVKFLCFDGEASKMHAGEILAGRTYPIVPFVPEVKTILDIGANVGATSVFLGLHYPGAQIFSVEPQALPFDLLKSNIQENPKNKCFNFRLFDCDKSVPLYHSWVESGPASIGQSWLNNYDHEMINLRDAATWVKEEQIQSIDILKIDTEGCEYQILTSLRSFLPTISVIYLEYHSEEDRRLIDDLVAETHVLYHGRIDKAHCGELTYVRSDLGQYSGELHKHRIKTHD